MNILSVDLKTQRGEVPGSPPNCVADPPRFVAGNPGRAAIKAGEGQGKFQYNYLIRLAMMKGQPEMHPSLSVVLPTYNERVNIGLLIPEIAQAFEDVLKEIIVVDDSSPDGTPEEVNRLKQTHPQVKLLVQREKGGIGKALRAGYEQATGEAILSSDVDLSFSVSDLRKIYEKLASGYDLVVGSRHTRLDDYEVPSWKIRLKYRASKFGNRLLNKIFHIPIHDFSANCRAIRSSLWRTLETREDTNFFLFEMILLAARAKARITEVSVSFKDRKYGISKINHWVEIPKAFVRMVAFLLVSRK